MTLSHNSLGSQQRTLSRGSGRRRASNDLAVVVATPALPAVVGVGIGGTWRRGAPLLGLPDGDARVPLERAGEVTPEMFSYATPILKRYNSRLQEVK